MDQDGFAPKTKIKGNKKRKAASPLSKAAFVALFDALAAEVSSVSPDARLASHTLLPPANITRESWRGRAQPDNNPVFPTFRDLGPSAADHKVFMENLFANGLGARAVRTNKEDPEHALDGVGVLALSLGYFLALQSESVVRLCKMVPMLDKEDLEAVWDTPEVLAVPKGQPMPPLQEAVDRIIRVRKPLEDTAKPSQELIQAIGDFAFVVNGDLSKNPTSKLHENVLDLVFYLEGLCETMIDIPPPAAKLEEAPPPAVPAPNLMDAPVAPSRAQLLLAEDVFPTSAPAPLISFVIPDEPKNFRGEEKKVALPSWFPKQEETPEDEEVDAEDMFAARLKRAVEATDQRLKWRM